MLTGINSLQLCVVHGVMGTWQRAFTIIQETLFNPRLQSLDILTFSDSSRIR